MPRVVVTEGAVRGLERTRLFLATKDPAAARRAADAIARQVARLGTAPAIGRPYPPAPDLRELVIPFGRTGYVALYSHDAIADVVYVLAVRHQKEAGY